MPLALGQTELDILESYVNIGTQQARKSGKIGGLSKSGDSKSGDSI